MTKFSSAESQIFVEGEVYLSRQEDAGHLSEPSVGRILFIVSGDIYGGVESPWNFYCSTHPEKRPMAVDPELKAEFDAWDAASDQDAEKLGLL